MPPSNSQSTARYRRLVAGIVLLAGVITLATMLPISEWLQATLQWAQNNRRISWLVYLSIYVAASIIAFPTWLITIAGGYLFGAVGGIAAAAAGALAGSTATFLIARTIAYDWVHQRFAGSARFQAIDRAIGKKALLIVMLTRLSLVIPYNVLNYMYGLTAVRLRDYVLGSLLGMMPVLGVYVMVGRGARDLDAIFAGEVDTGMNGKLLLAVGLVFAVMVVLLITRYATQALRAELDDPPPS